MSSMQNLSPREKAQGHAEKTKVFPWRRHNTNISSFLLPTSGPNTKATQQMQRIRQTNPIPAKHRRNPPHPNPPPARVEADYQDYNTQKLAPIQKIPQVQIETHQDADKAAQQAIHTRIHSLPNLAEQQEKIGKTKTGLMWPSSYAKSHPAAPLLDSFASQGCPVDCGPDWTEEQLIEALKYGSHPSAKIPEAFKCLLEETQGKVDKGFARVTTWGELKKRIPKKLKLSPAAMIPHKSRAFRCILDLSFLLKVLGQHYKSVNETTNKQAPQESMAQLGSALKRIIAQVADNQHAKRPVLFAKLDIKDGFWRLVVSDDDAWNFCYCLPNEDPNAHLDETKIVVPNSLQMGWCESPPFFCAASETARDVIASLLGTDLPPHPFESRMLPTNFTTFPIDDLTSTMSLLEVFVDDFIGCTDILSQKHILNITRAMLHGIHSVFPPPSVTNHNGGDPISEKKLDKLEGLWSHVKELLGWIIDGANYTICLPPEKVQKITKSIKQIKKRNGVKLLEFQKIAGTLHHASMGIPGGRGLFTEIWSAMAKSKGGWVKITVSLQNIFDDFLWLFREIANKPINVAQLVPSLPDIHGYSDACKHGAGGVWIIPHGNEVRYIYWTCAFPSDISAQMETRELSINDLEMAGVLLEWLALEHLIPSMSNTQIGIQCDNTSTVHWTRKFTARSLRAGHLLRALSLRQQICKSAPLVVISIEGKLNDMADVASRYATDKAMQARSPTLLSYFNSKFKQKNSWEEFHFPPRLISLVMSSLRGTQLTLEWWRRLPGLVKNTGDTGVVTQPPSKSTLYSKKPILSSEMSSLQHSLLGSGQGTTAGAVKSLFKESLTPLRPLARPSNWLDSKVPYTGTSINTTSKSNDVSKV